MLDVSKLEQRREILGWRDSHCQKIETQLKHDCVLLREEIGQDLDSAKWSQLIRSRNFLETDVKPVLTNWMREQTEALLSAAQKDLRRISMQELGNPGLPPMMIPIEHKHFMIDLAVPAFVASVAVGTGVGLASSILQEVGVGGFKGVRPCNDVKSRSML